MHALKIDLMTLLVIAVVIGVGLTMALSHTATADQVHSAAPHVSVKSQLQTSSNPIRAHFIRAAEPVAKPKAQSRI